MGKLITISGASASGKTTLAREMLITQYHCTKMITSLTSRKRRGNDIPGEYDYDCQIDPDSGKFLWVVSVHGNRYATARDSVLRALNDGSETAFWIMILAPSVLPCLAEMLLDERKFDQLYSFYRLSPPVDELKKRLERRNSADEVERRLQECQDWDVAARNSEFPYRFIEGKGDIETISREVIKCIT